MKVKICGITNHEDAQKAAFYGAWAVGFIFYKKSPRYISPSRAKKLIDALPPFITPVGVFVNQKEGAVRDVCRFTGISTLQFHGDEEPAFCHRFAQKNKVIKAFRVGDDFSFAKTARYNKVHAFLFDAHKEGEYGGTGESPDWKFIAMQKIEKPYILSGGLTPNNLQEALSVLSPYAVDVSSGVEKSPGIKDPRKIRAFFDVLKFEQGKS
ncbi:MAG: phosphoribosylanthranilate isomerase [Candidatus Omnitrophica bacterium]|nr:phosphoribosylanthranilate isomerase [Candidatus Omnitrophota bacterium]